MNKLAIQFMFLSLFSLGASSISAQLNIGIKITVSGNDVNLYWVAEDQADIELYELDRSIDGRNWTNVVAKDGTGAETDAYSHDDLDLANGSYAYRLRVTFSNGDIEIIGHEIVEINVAPVFGNTSLFPDLVKFNPINE